MSDVENPPKEPDKKPDKEPNSPPVPHPAPISPPAPRSGCLTAFMAILGIFLLLPGICAVIFGVDALSSPRPDPFVMQFVIPGLILGFGGVMLIWSVIRNRRRR